jgi:anti-sigma regulatory factor (Ser/Thr protein kinase)
VPQTGFHHEAMLYASQAELVDRAAAFVREGVERGEPVLVVVDAEKIAALEERLGAAGHDGHDDVTFADMTTLGRNPARIIPAWRDFVERHRRPGRRLRGIGEPVGSHRTPTELAECRQHEALLNLAFADTDGFTLLCPYDVAHLDPGVIDEAHRTHPAVRLPGGRAASGRYDGVQAAALLAEPLDPPPADAAVLVFDDRMQQARRFATAFATRAGAGDRVTDVALVVGELATNSLCHGGGHGTLRMWTGEGTLVCEVADHGVIVDPLVGRRRPHERQLGGRGLWLVNQVCDLVQIRSTGAGTTIRAHLAHLPLG